jgi:hypothetical protein
MKMNQAPFSAIFSDLLPPYQMGGPVHPRPLSRYLPPLPSGMVKSWLGQHPDNHEMILDPFGLSPDLDLELVQAGRKVLVCVNNPILRVLLELAAQPPSEEELNRCVNNLASTVKSGQRLEQQIQALYQTTCNGCGKTIQASAYHWERGSELPYAREYTCPYCWESGTFPILAEDELTLAPVKRAPLQRAWAIERIAPPGDPLREDAIEVVDSHLARPLYVVFMLINRLESLELGEREQLILNGLLLNILDDATPIHSIEHAIQRPRQLVVPNRFRENNLWMSFEKSIEYWKKPDKRLKFSVFPEFPDGPGICLFNGRSKDLADQVLPEKIARVVTALPRPAQAFWTLSAAWSAWLLGREEAASMAQVISRRRYDWNWHTSALNGTWRSIRKILADDVECFNLLPEVEPAFLTTVFHAMEQSGFTCQGLSIRAEDQLAQTVWRYRPTPLTAGSGDLARVVQQTSINYLNEKREPADYLEMSAASSLALCKQGLWPVDQTQTSVLQQIRAAFSNPAVFSHYGSGEQTLESGSWWLYSSQNNLENLSDQIEDRAIQILSRGYFVTIRDLEQEIRENIRPIFCPIEEYIQHILQSYAEEEQAGSGKWQIKVHEHPTLRDSDIKTIRGMIDQLGRRLGFETRHQGGTVEWLDRTDQAIRYRFYILTSTRISSILSIPNMDGIIRSLVIPGSRSNLLAYKLKNNPWMAEQMAEDWHSIKFRHISRLSENPMLTVESLQLWLDSDPPEYQPLQMDLF